MTNNFGITDSLIDAVKKIHDAEVEKQATSASDAEEKNAQFLVDQAERIAKYAKQVFGEGYVGDDGFLHTPRDAKAPKFRSKEEVARYKAKREKRKENKSLQKKTVKEESTHEYPEWLEKKMKKPIVNSGEMNRKMKTKKWQERNLPPKGKANEEVEPEEQLDEAKKAVSWLSPEAQKKYAKEKKENKMFASAKREINHEKKKERPASEDRWKHYPPYDEEVESQEQIDEKYLGFKKLEGKLAGKGVRNPGAVAASIGRKKYGAGKFNKAAHEHHKMRGMKAENTDYIEEAMKQRILEKVMELRNKDKE